MHIVLQGARGYSASKGASNPARSPDSAMTSCRDVASRSSAAKVAFCRKISEDRYQFRRLTVLKKTTPPPRSPKPFLVPVEKYREILVPFAARCAKWVIRTLDQLAENSFRMGNAGIAQLVQSG